MEGNRQKRGTGKRTRRAGCQTVEELPCCWSLAGDVVARCGDGIALNRTGWPSFPHPVRCCERVRRRAAGDGVDGKDIRRSRREARNWRRWRRHPSPWFSLFLFCLFVCYSFPHNLNEENEDEDEEGRMADRRGAALSLLVAGDVVARCGDDIDQKRTGWPPFPSVMVRRSDG